MSDEQLLNELAIVAAGTHRLRVDLKMEVEPVIDLGELTQEESAALEVIVKEAIQEAIKGRPLLYRSGKNVYAALHRFTRIACGPVNESW